MSDLLFQFVASAKSIALSETEKAHVRETLATNMRCEGSMLRSARGTVLTVEEKREGRKALQEFMGKTVVHSGEKSTSLDIVPEIVGQEYSCPTISGVICFLTGKIGMTRRGVSRDTHFSLPCLNILRCFLSLRFASGVMAAVVIFFSVGGAAAYAAESALPGNPLYPLKIYITEPLREHLSLTPRARAAWRAERIVRRLHEEEELLASAPDREKDADFLEERIIHHMEKMEERLAEMESEDDKEVLRIRLEGAIRHHEDVLFQWEKHELPMEKVPEFHKRMKQKKQFLRNVFREYVRKPVKDVFEVKGEVEVDEHGDETEESQETEEKAGERSDGVSVAFPEESMEEKHVPRIPVILPKPLPEIHKKKETIRRDMDADTKERNESSEQQNNVHTDKKEEQPSFFEDLQREILPSALFKRFPREE